MKKGVSRALNWQLELSHFLCLFFVLVALAQDCPTLPCTDSIAIYGLAPPPDPTPAPDPPQQPDPAPAPKESPPKQDVTPKVKVALPQEPSPSPAPKASPPEQNNPPKVAPSEVPNNPPTPEEPPPEQDNQRKAPPQITSASSTTVSSSPPPSSGTTTSLPLPSYITSSSLTQSTITSAPRISGSISSVVNASSSSSGCGQCSVYAERVSVYFFPTGDVKTTCSRGAKVGHAEPTKAPSAGGRFPSNATHVLASTKVNGGVGGSQVIDGYTFNYPSTYISVLGALSVSDSCGVKGGQYTDPKPFAVQAITTASYESWPSTCRSQGGYVNVVIDTMKQADIACPTWGVSDPFYTTCDDHVYLTATYGPPYNPVILVPNEILNIDPAWGACKNAPRDGPFVMPCGIYDPPRALQTGESMMAPPEDPASAAKAAPVAPVVGPEQTSDPQLKKPEQDMTPPDAAQAQTEDPKKAEDPGASAPTPPKTEQKEQKPAAGQPEAGTQDPPTSPPSDPQTSKQAAGEKEASNDPANQQQANQNQGVQPPAEQQPTNQDAKAQPPANAPANNDQSPETNGQNNGGATPDAGKKAGSDPAAGGQSQNDPAANAAQSPQSGGQTEAGTDPNAGKNADKGTGGGGSGSDSGGGSAQNKPAPLVPIAQTTVALQAPEPAPSLGQIIADGFGRTEPPSTGGQSPANNAGNAAGPGSAGAGSQNADSSNANPPGVNPPAAGSPNAGSSGADSPAAGSPGAGSPGAGSPGSNAPGSNVPGSNAPGSNAPGSNAPGSNPPGSNPPAAGSPNAGSPNPNPVPGSASPPPNDPAQQPNANSPAAQNPFTPHVLTLAGQTLQIPNPTAAMIASQTLSAGSPAFTTNGHFISLASGGSLVAGTLAPSPPALTVAGQTYTANPSSQFVIAGQTLTPGGAVTVSGTPISVDKAGQTAVVDGTPQALYPTATAPLPVITAAGHSYTASSVGGAVVFGIEGQTLSPGGVVTVDGTTISLPVGGDGMTAVVNGSPQSLHVASTTSAPSGAGPGSIMTLDNGEVVTAQSTGFVVDGGKTVLPGGPAVTVGGGEVISLGSDGVIDVNGSASVTLASIGGVPAATGTGTAPSGARSGGVQPFEGGAGRSKDKSWELLMLVGVMCMIVMI